MQSSKTIARRHQPSLDVLKRSAKACNRCRKRRTKCLGDPPYPCISCSETGHACVYAESEKRVTVTESYLLELQAQARRATATRQDGVADVADASQDIELGFTGTDNWVVGRSGEYHFMGNSSSTYIANRLNPTAETLAWHKYPHHEDTLWLKRSNSPELPPLPPFEIAQRLYRAQHAYIGTIFAFLSDSAFNERLEHVYAHVPDPNDREERLVYCQILLVFAFGQMYSINHVEIPSNVILKNVGPRWYLPALVLCFGFVSLCTAFVQTYASMIVVRALLGIFEGGAMPGTAFFLSCFYKKTELFFRMSIFIASSSLASSFGGLLAAGLSNIPNWGTSAMVISRWRNIFFFEGLVTVLVAMIAPFFMPQSPGAYKFLTPRQRYIAAERLRRENPNITEEKVTWKHVQHAIFNIHTNVCAWCFFCTNSAVQGFGAFIPTILREFGWTSTEAQLKSVPPYLVACCVTITLGYLSDRTNKRGVFMAGILPCSIIGFSILRFSTNTDAKYAAVFLNAIACFGASSGFLSWGINNAGSPAVAAVAGGYMVMVGSMGGVLSTWTYLSRDSPLFHTGHTIKSLPAVLLLLSGLLWPRSLRV